MPEYRIVGSSTSDLSDEDFRHLARHACDQYATGKISLLQWANFEKRLTFSSTTAGPEALADAVAQGRGRHRRGAAPAALPEHPARRRTAPSSSCWPTPSWSSGRGSSWRSRSAPTWPAPGRSTTCCTSSSTRSRSSASTTSSARRRPRTSWPSASPTASSSRSGTATTSTTCRSTCPRRSAVDDRVGFYEATGAFKDMVVTHLFQILGFMAMEPPTALDAGRHQRGEEQGLPLHAPARRDPGRARPVRGLPRHPRRGARLGHRDLRRPALRHRQLALGRRALLPAHRQAARRRRAHHLHRLP